MTLMTAGDPPEAWRGAVRAFTAALQSLADPGPGLLASLEAAEATLSDLEPQLPLAGFAPFAALPAEPIPRQRQGALEAERRAGRAPPLGAQLEAGRLPPGLQTAGRRGSPPPAPAVPGPRAGPEMPVFSFRRAAGPTTPAEAAGVSSRRRPLGPEEAAAPAPGAGPPFPEGTASTAAAPAGRAASSRAAAGTPPAGASLLGTLAEQVLRPPAAESSRQPAEARMPAEAFPRRGQSSATPPAGRPPPPEPGSAPAPARTAPPAPPPWPGPGAGPVTTATRQPAGASTAPPWEPGGSSAALLGSLAEELLAPRPAPAIPGGPEGGAAAAGHASATGWGEAPSEGRPEAVPSPVMAAGLAGPAEAAPTALEPPQTAAGPPLDAAALAELVNEALAEQARRHGVDLS